MVDKISQLFFTFKVLSIRVMLMTSVRIHCLLSCFINIFCKTNDTNCYFNIPTLTIIREFKESHWIMARFFHHCRILLFKIMLNCKHPFLTLPFSDSSIIWLCWFLSMKFEHYNWLANVKLWKHYIFTTRYVFQYTFDKKYKYISLIVSIFSLTGN